MAVHIAWREGLFIRPQHFQQEGSALDREMRLRTLVSGSNKWGLFSLEIDDQFLGMGKVSIASVSGIMPDGTIFDSKDFVHRLTIDIDKDDSGKALYLALPLAYENEDNIYFEEQDPLPTRYAAKVHKDVPNTNAGEESLADITFSHLNFSLQKEGSLLEGYSTLQIARIGSISATNTVSIDESFIPTYLHLNASEQWMSRLQDLLGMLRYRAEKIAEKLTGGNLQSTELGDYLILQLLNRSESRLHYFLTQDHHHPGDLHVELSAIAGELAVFLRQEKRLASPFTYRHETQNTSLDEVFGELKKLLSQVLESKSLQIPLQAHKYGVHIASTPDKSLFVRSVLILTVSSNVDGERLKKLLLDNLKIGTVEEISNLVNHHLPGFKIEPLTSAPREIPFRVDQRYFKIHLTGEDKKKLRRSSGMALHYPETENVQMEFALWSIKEQVG